MGEMRHLELGGGRVETNGITTLTVPPTASGYADAQIDDYGVVGRNGRSRYKWQPNTRLQLDAKFSHEADQLKGTAGFGFWNAPFGDPTIKRPALPQAAWFFFGSAPNDLLFFPEQTKTGWAASTLDAKSWRALRWSPLTPLVLLGNQFPAFKRRVWPRVRRDLGITAVPLKTTLTQWHSYRINWVQTGCKFWIDDALVLDSPTSPKGSLGFVCWIDNQFMVVRENGRFNWGTLPTTHPQTLQIRDLKLRKTS